MHCVQAGVATNQPWKATAVQLLGLLLSAAKRSESLAGCSSPFARHAPHTATADPDVEHILDHSNRQHLPPLSSALACVNLLRNIAASLLSLKTQNLYNGETSTWHDV